jgi:hypothetical protein
VTTSESSRRPVVPRRVHPILAVPVRASGVSVPVPTLFNQIGQRFRRAVASFADANDIPWIKFGRDDDKLAVMTPHLRRQAATGASGVAAIGVAQEFQRVWTATEGRTSTGTPRWSFYKADRRVYFPYPGKVWINGHEWAKRQATKARIGFTELSNGFASTEDPEALQEICDRLGAGTINVFVQWWLARLPLPLGQTDRHGGYWWETSMRQVEIARTLVFDAPRHARGFFEALIVDNLDLGRPHNVESSSTAGSAATPSAPSAPPSTAATTAACCSTSSTATRGSCSTSTRQDGAAMRIDTVINSPRDLGCNARLPTSTTCRPKSVPATGGSWMLNGSVRAVSSRAQPLSGSRTPPPTRRVAGPRPCGSAILGSWP